MNKILIIFFLSFLFFYFFFFFSIINLFLDTLSTSFLFPITFPSRQFSQIQNAIAPVREHVVPTSHAPQMIRQRLFLPQPVAGDTSSTDPASDDTTTDVYAPVLKQLIPMRKNNHIVGSNISQNINGNSNNNNLKSSNNSSRSEKREYIDIPLPKSVLQINLKSHDANCARYNYVSSKNNFVKTTKMEPSECGCQRNDEHQDVSSNR